MDDLVFWGLAWLGLNALFLAAVVARYWLVGRRERW